MKKSQLEHLLRAAAAILGETQFIVIGSQSLHGKHPDLCEQVLVSMEADLIAKDRPARTEVLNVIGVDSPFHDEFGYYADPVDEQTAVLPRGWRGRLVNLVTRDGITALCLDPHDMAISKYIAGRDKDRALLRELIGLKLIDEEILLARARGTPISAPERSRVAAMISADFGPPLSARTPSRPRR